MLAAFSITPQKARLCSQRKGSRAESVNHPQTQNCIFEAQIYSFLFQLSVQTPRKRSKSLGNKAFCAISCKIVISDKW
jgi:hypothetical protein